MAKNRLLLIVLIFCIFFIPNSIAQEIKVEASYGDGVNVFSLATGSPGELGLLKVLGEAFAEKENARLDWVKA